MCGVGVDGFVGCFEDVVDVVVLDEGVQCVQLLKGFVGVDYQYVEFVVVEDCVWQQLDFVLDYFVVFDEYGVIVYGDCFVVVDCDCDVGYFGFGESLVYCFYVSQLVGF